MDWLQKLNADYITQTNSKSDQLKNYLNMEETNYQYSIKGSSLSFDKKKIPSHEEDNQNNCPSSGTKFSTEESLENQISSDHEKKKFYTCIRWPYKCTVCDDSSSKEKCIKPHVTSVHEKIKPHKCSSDSDTFCDVCEKYYSSKYFLKDHIAGVHEGKKPYKCTNCKVSFSFKGSWKRHNKRCKPLPEGKDL